MNVFRLVGDSSHLLAILWLLTSMLLRKSCRGYSGKTQILYLTVFVFRYVDLFFNFISAYNSAMKAIFILSKATIVFLMFGLFRETRQKQDDTFRAEILFFGATILAYFVNHELSVMEILWTISIYLESVCIIPQLYMMKNTGKLHGDQLIYLTLLGSYRFWYILNWIYRYNTEQFYDLIAIAAGVVQTCIYVLAMIILVWNKHWSQQLNTISMSFHDSKEFDDDECWLIENDLEKTEKGLDCEAINSSLAPAIQKLRIDLVPGPNMGLEKTQKDKEVEKEKYAVEEALDYIFDYVYYTSRNVEEALDYIFDYVYYTSRKAINDAYTRYVHNTYMRFVNYKIWN